MFLKTVFGMRQESCLLVKCLISLIKIELSTFEYLFSEYSFFNFAGICYYFPNYQLKLF